VISGSQIELTYVAVDHFWCPLVQIFESKGDVEHHPKLRKDDKHICRKAMLNAYDLCEGRRIDAPLWQ
jgi:hypothetical protein